ncbi:unnamed protein product [Amoebophrya sp. A25]|nr:unnamed protein product [Amoebophrya sp. A25]|eukprot:GSA25T00022384001.1
MRKYVNGALGLPTVDTATNRKDLYDQRSRVGDDLERHRLCDEQEAKLRGEIDEQEVVETATKRRYVAPRDIDIQMSTMAKMEEYKNLPPQDRMKTIMTKIGLGKGPVVTESMRLNYKVEEVELDSEEEDEETLQRPFRSKYACEVALAFYDTTQECVLKRISNREHTYKMGPLLLGAECDRAQHLVTRSVPAVTFHVEKVGICYRVGRLLYAVKEREKVVEKGDIFEDLIGDLDPAVLDLAKIGVGAEVDNDQDVDGDRAALEARKAQDIEAPLAALKNGVVIKLKRKNGGPSGVFMVVGIDMGSYHFRAIELMEVNSSERMTKYQYGERIITTSNPPVNEFDCSDCSIHLVFDDSSATLGLILVVINEEMPRIQKPPPPQKPAVLPAEAAFKSKLERRLLEAKALKQMDFLAGGDSIAPQQSIKTKVTKPAEPKIPRPPALKQPATSAKASSSTDTQVIEPLSSVELKKHQEEKVAQTMKIGARLTVEGFSIALDGSTTTQRVSKRAYDRMRVRITDRELKKLFLECQKHPAVDLLAGGTKEARRYFSFKQDEEEFGEAISLLWSSRTRFILDHIRTYLKNGLHKNGDIYKSRLDFASSVRPAVVLCQKIAGDAPEKKKLIDKCKTLPDTLLQILDHVNIIPPLDQLE